MWCSVLPRSQMTVAQSYSQTPAHSPPQVNLHLACYMAGKDCCLARPCRSTGQRLGVPADAGNNT